VPAAAVIPAPIAYIKVVAVKKLVVCFLIGFDGVYLQRILQSGQIISVQVLLKN
jgi:hypothetical protein